MPQPDSKLVMPDTDEAQPVDGGLVDAVAQHIKDDIDDHRSLRNCRFALAIVLLFVAAAFYVVFFWLLCIVLLNLSAYKPILESQTITVAVILALVIVPTLLVLVVARAVFGMNKSDSSLPSSPLQALIHLMKEMKGA